jgi:hypothetical protein
MGEGGQHLILIIFTEQYYREEMVPYRKCSQFFNCNFNCDVLIN